MVNIFIAFSSLIMKTSYHIWPIKNFQKSDGLLGGFEGIPRLGNTGSHQQNHSEIDFKYVIFLILVKVKHSKLTVTILDDDYDSNTILTTISS